MQFYSKLTALCCLVVALFFSTPFAGHAQQDAEQGPLFMVSCLKAKSMQAEAMLEDVAKPFHEALIKQKKIADWMVYRVAFPNGEDCECDYREVTVVASIEQMNAYLSDEEMMAVGKEVFPDRNMEELMGDMMATFSWGGSEVYGLIDQLLPPNDGPPSKLISVNFMTVAPMNGAAYVEAEQKAWKPLHEARKKAGLLENWLLFGRILPQGTDFDGNYVTVDAWGSMENMMAPVPDGLFEEVHPDKNFGKVMGKTAALRELKRSELWMLKMRAAQPAAVAEGR